jgi:hypothetical protein
VNAHRIALALIEGQKEREFLRRAKVFGAYHFERVPARTGESYAVWYGDRIMGQLRREPEFPWEDARALGPAFTIAEAWVITDWWHGNVRQGHPSVYGTPFRTRQEAADFLRQTRFPQAA